MVTAQDKNQKFEANYINTLNLKGSFNYISPRKNHPLKKLLIIFSSIIIIVYRTFKSILKYIVSLSINLARMIRKSDLLMSLSFFTLIILTTIITKYLLVNPLIGNLVEVETINAAQELSELEGNHIESYFQQKPTLADEANIIKKYTISDTSNTSLIRSEDKRVRVLEEYFKDKNSELSNYADKFIENVKRYNIQNWQLIPAIAIAETNGCQTDISIHQKNCWGYGGGPETRVWFSSFEDAIDIVSEHMINSYGNERMNAKDIQNTYCGNSCAEQGWKWAMRVNYYVSEINDYAELYGLERTNEITNFDED